MSQQARMGRRRFLVTIGALGGAVAIGGGVAVQRAWDRMLGSRLTEILGERESARTIGRAWLEQERPGQPGQHDALVRGLLADLGSRVRLADRDELRRRVTARVESDYAAGRVTQVGGWVLSRTEVRLCALAALAAPAAPAKATASPGRPAA